VDSAQKNVDKLTPKYELAKERAAKAKKVRDELDQQLEAATAELEFAKKHPALEGGAAQPAAVEAEVVKSEDEPGPAAEPEVAKSEDEPGPSEDEVVAAAKARVAAKKARDDLFDQDDPFA
jgi:hypothetical protein